MITDRGLAYYSEHCNELYTFWRLHWDSPYGPQSRDYYVDGAGRWRHVGDDTPVLIAPNLEVCSKVEQLKLTTKEATWH